MKNLYCIVLLFAAGICLPGQAGSQTTLTVLNPQKQWQKAQGTIEAATFAVHPKGVYMECGLYLTFSAKGKESIYSDDSLEVVYNFSLPEGAILHDSWLWIDDNIARAKILDRWTASQIYEGTVKRRQDPSILTKNSATSYQLRVYPLLKGKTRRVKITYLLPVDWTKKDVKINFPIELVAASAKAVSPFNLLVFPEPNWENPTLTGLPGGVLQPLQDPQGGTYFGAALAQAQYNLKPAIRFASPMKNGVYLATYGDPADGIYQLALLPSTYLQENLPLKFAVVFDYEAGGVSGLDFKSLLDRTREQLKEALATNDSFNLFLPSFSVQPFSPGWIPANEAAIDQAFDALPTSAGGYSQLPAQLWTALQFLKQQGGGQILLLSNTAGFSNLNSANQFISDLFNAMGSVKTPVHIIDFRTVSSPYFYAGNQVFYANSYLYNNLAQQTGGVYTNIRELQLGLNKTFSNGFAGLGLRLENFEMITTTTNGFCYGRFNVNVAKSPLAPLHRPVLQVGKYKGDFPMKITFSGELDGKILYETREVPPTEVHAADSLNREMWYGNFIDLLETQSVGAADIAEVIYNSLQERVLSRYTAFLCVEDPATYCADCVDETQSTATDAPVADSTLLAFPNPFTDKVTIRATTGLAGDDPATMEVYDIAGRLVRVLTPEKQAGHWTGVWRGEQTSGEQAAPGVYVVLVRAGQFSRALRVVKGKG